MTALHESNLKSGNPGVRWQAQMEDHLEAVRERQTVLAGMSVVRDAEAVALHASVMQANATAALALAIANTGSDLELAVTKLAEASA